MKKKTCSKLTKDPDKHYQLFPWVLLLPMVVLLILMTMLLMMMMLITMMTMMMPSL